MTKDDRLPAPLQALIDAIDACERDADAIVGGLSESEVNWQPVPGASWSVAQCLDHLTIMNGFYLPRFVERVDEARRTGRGHFVDLSPSPGGRWFIASFEPPVKRKMKAPAQAVPHSSLPLAGLVEAYKASHDLYRRLVHGSAHVDVNRVTAMNPFLKIIPMRVSTVLLIIPAHDRRHLWQARRVKEQLQART